MNNLLNIIESNLHLISISTIAGFLASFFGGDVLLLIMVQYLFLIDSILNILISTSPIYDRIYESIKKYISLYLGVIIIGLGTKAFDVSISSEIELSYAGSFFFDLFIYFLIIVELLSINKYLSYCGFSVNVGIDKIFTMIFNKFSRKHKLDLNSKDLENIYKEEKLK